MRTFNITVSTFIAFGCVVAFSGNTASAQYMGGLQQRTNRYIEVTGKVLQRPGTDNGFAVAVDGLTEAPLLTSSDITDLGGGSGGEAKFGWTNRYGVDWEIRTNLGKFQNNASVSSPSGSPVTSPLFEGGQVGGISYDYTSEFYSFELNHRRSLRPGCTWVVGPRFISLKENFDFNTETSIGGFDFTTTNSFATSNSLIGGQAGLEFGCPLTPALKLKGFLRVGGYGNPTALRTTASNSFQQGQQAESTKGIASFVGECGGTAYYEIVPNTWSAFVGYEATWIDGVALAPTQALSVGETEIITNNTPFWHSINFGLRFDF